MSGGITWLDDGERCVVGGTTFQTLPVDLLDRHSPTISLDGADFLLFKEPPVVDRYAALIAELRPRHIVELGILEGGSTALLLELANPQRLVAIDRKGPTQPTLDDYVVREGLEEVARLHEDVDQADRERLAAIVADEFVDSPLDLVVDDCSHMYEATLASFNELFPRLRTGGVYLIEDWPWAHENPVADIWVDQVPLTRLVLEIGLALPSKPGLISEIRIDEDWVQVRRGEAEIDPSAFDVAAVPDEAGRLLLADDAAPLTGPYG